MELRWRGMPACLSSVVLLGTPAGKISRLGKTHVLELPCVHGPADPWAGTVSIGDRTVSHTVVGRRRPRPRGTQRLSGLLQDRPNLFARASSCIGRDDASEPGSGRQMPLSSSLPVPAGSSASPGPSSDVGLKSRPGSCISAAPGSVLVGASAGPQVWHHSFICRRTPPPPPPPSPATPRLSAPRLARHRASDLSLVVAWTTAAELGRFGSLQRPRRRGVAPDQAPSCSR